jgi:hypothetical protein
MSAETHYVAANPSKNTRIATVAAVLIGVLLMFVQYTTIKHSHFDDTFIYLHIAQNAVETGSWQYFPNTDRPALLASSPLRIMALTTATFIAWPLTAGVRSFESGALVLPLSAVVTCLFFLPFWWRDRWRFLLLAAPYFLFAATFEAIAEFEAGLLYWWVVTIIRDYVERVDTRLAAVAAMAGVFIRPDVAIVVLTALTLGYGAREDLNRHRLWRWSVVTLVLGTAWIALCSLFSVWPLPTTYWTKGALPELFEPSLMISFLSPRLGESAFGAWRQTTSINAAISASWLALLIIIAAQSRALAGWRLILLLTVTILLLSRLPASYYWYYQNMWISGAAVALALWVCTSAPRTLKTRTPIIALIVLSFSIPLAGRLLRDSGLPWDFARPTRVQGYLAMAKTFDRAGTIELPGLGRGYLKSPEIGITAYFGGQNSWIWDSAGLAQAHPKAYDSHLRSLYRGRLHKPPTEDLITLSKGGAAAPVFEAWALDTRAPKTHVGCLHVLLNDSVCVTKIFLDPRSVVAGEIK